MGLDGSFRIEGLAFLLGGKGHVGTRSQAVRKLMLMGLRESDGDQTLDVERWRCDEKFTHITGMKLWAVRLDVELESSSSFLHRADRSCLSALLSTP